MLNSGCVWSNLTTCAYFSEWFGSTTKASKLHISFAPFPGGWLVTPNGGDFFREFISPKMAWSFRFRNYNNLPSIFANKQPLECFWILLESHFDLTKEFGGPTHHLLDDGWSLVIVKHRWKMADGHHGPTQKCDALHLLQCFRALNKSANFLVFENTWEGRVFGERQFLEKKDQTTWNIFWSIFFFLLSDSVVFSKQFYHFFWVVHSLNRYFLPCNDFFKSQFLPLTRFRFGPNSLPSDW